MRRLIFSLAIFIPLIPNFAFAIHPYKDYVATPDQYKLEYDSINISTKDHCRLTGWYCKPQVDSSKFLIVLAGTDAGNMSYDLPIVQLLAANLGVPVLLFDYRGFGSSQAFAYDSNAIGHPEYLIDIDAAVDFARQHYPNRILILYGRSLGASLAIIEGCRQSGISGIIAESPYVSQQLLKKHFEAVNPERPVLPIKSNDLEPLVNIRNFRAKNLLVLHGAREQYILTNELEPMVNKILIARKRFLDFEGCDHLELPFKDMQEFEEAIERFLTASK
jgi:alpha/beta superfamily hydrolase